MCNVKYSIIKRDRGGYKNEGRNISNVKGYKSLRGY